MATHSSVLAWRIPGTGEPGGLLSMGSHRVGHDLSDLAAAAAAAGSNTVGESLPNCILWPCLYIFTFYKNKIICTYCFAACLFNETVLIFHVNKYRLSVLYCKNIS